MNVKYKEIEARFLEIEKEKLKNRLQELGAKDIGEDLLEEIIFYDQKLEWLKSNVKFVRLRSTRGKVFMTYKNQSVATVDGTEEIELTVSDMESATLLLEKIGLIAYRRQQKKRHTFQLEEVTVDIDTWPKVPTYVELEGPSESALRSAAAKLNLDWSNAIFENPRYVIEKHYGIPVGHLRWFTFDRLE